MSPQGENTMAISSINVQAVTSHAIAHNERVSSPSYLIGENENSKNEFVSYLQENETFETIKDQISKDYEKTNSRKYQTNSVPVKEAVLNLNAHHTIKDVEKVALVLQKEFGYRPLHIAIHQDEGHISEDGEKHFNHHAHIVFQNYDLDKHKTPRLNATDMRRMQTVVADTLGMQRGEDKKITGKQRLEHWEYRKAQEAKTIIEITKEQSKTLKEELKELKMLQQQKREELKASGATRADYAQMEQKYKELKLELEQKNKENKTQFDELDRYKKVGSEFAPSKEWDSPNQKWIPAPMNSWSLEEKIEKVAMDKNRSEFIEKEWLSLKKEVGELKKQVKASSATTETVDDIEREHTKQEAIKINDTAPKDEEISTLRNEIQITMDKYSKKDFAKNLIAKNSNALGIVDKKALAEDITLELRASTELTRKTYNMLIKIHEIKNKVIDTFKILAESSKMHLEAIFVKITGKSLERTQKDRAGSVRDEKVKEQSEPKKEKSSGLER
jgi:hypothetical protein